MVVVEGGGDEVSMASGKSNNCFSFSPSLLAFHYIVRARAIQPHRFTMSLSFSLLPSVSLSLFSRPSLPRPLHHRSRRPSGPGGHRRRQPVKRGRRSN